MYLSFVNVVLYNSNVFSLRFLIKSDKKVRLKMIINNFSTINNQTFTHRGSNQPKTPRESLVKKASVLTSAIGVGTAYALIAKKQSFSLSPKKIYETPIKDWSILKLYDKKKPASKLITIKEPEILALAGSSVAGGFLGGAVTDNKKNLKAKGREALNQMLGNVMVPVGCVSLTSHIYTKFEPNFMNHIPQLKGSTKFVKAANTALKSVPMALMTLAGLSTGIILGNKVSNFINDKLYHKKVERNIKPTDFAPHVDDIGMAVTLMAEKSKLSSAITNTVPFFLCVPGVQTGIAKEH